MTTYITKICRDSVEILSDGGVTSPYSKGPELRFQSAVTKTLFSPYARLAVTSTSQDKRVADFCNNMAIKAAAFGSFDLATHIIQCDLADLSARIAAGAPEKFAVGQVSVLGISETRGPIGFIYRTKRFFDQDNEPRKLYPSPAFYAIGSKLTPEEEAACIAAPSLLPLALDLVTALRARRPIRMCGHVDYTVVTADGCSSKRIIEWPDQPGDVLEVMQGPEAMP